MKKVLKCMLLLLTISYPIHNISAAPQQTTPEKPTPQQDLKNFRQFFKDRFPKVKFQSYKDGIYGIDDNHKGWICEGGWSHCHPYK